MAFAEDLTAFVRDADFSVAATLAGIPVRSGVIFDAAYLEPLGNQVEGTGPVALAIAAELGAVAHGQALVVNGTTFLVRGVEPDGTGMVLLRLEEQ
jgi:hypothetical protein